MRNSPNMKRYLRKCALNVRNVLKKTHSARLKHIFTVAEILGTFITLVDERIC